MMCNRGALDGGGGQCRLSILRVKGPNRGGRDIFFFFSYLEITIHYHKVTEDTGVTIVV